jgi:hypothetical protein
MAARRASIENLQIPNDRNTPYGRLTTSVGVATIGPGDLAADDATWLARADAALYRAKVNGRNRSESGPGEAPSNGTDPTPSAAQRPSSAPRAVTVRATRDMSARGA